MARQCDTQTRTGEDTGTEPSLSFVVIGYNEEQHLPGCFQSVRDMTPVPGVSYEVIYVDGGSTDESVRIARAAGLSFVSEAPTQRRAAENRNIGLRQARGTYIQFLDGDMALDPDWPTTAIKFLDATPDVAAVCGNLQEMRDSALFRAIELDWGVREGPIRHCGGAAMWRRSLLEAAGGFPENVRYGEEPYLCWRVRNEFGKTIYQLNRRMVFHDLGHTSFVDYWRRCVRTGEAYAEIAAQFKSTPDPLWLRESRINYFWCGAFLALLFVILFAPMPLRIFAGALLAAVLARKWIEGMRKGLAPHVALIYSAHTYFCKFPLAFGQARWRWIYGAKGPAVG